MADPPHVVSERIAPLQLGAHCSGGFDGGEIAIASILLTSSGKREAHFAEEVQEAGRVAFAIPACVRRQLL